MMMMMIFRMKGELNTSLQLIEGLRKMMMIQTIFMMMLMMIMMIMIFLLKGEMSTSLQLIEGLRGEVEQKENIAKMAVDSNTVST